MRFLDLIFKTNPSIRGGSNVFNQSQSNMFTFLKRLNGALLVKKNHRLIPSQRFAVAQIH
jgi:hypothetical protein